MQLPRTLILPTLFALVPLASVSSADGLNPDRIPEGTTWVAHVDVEGFSTTKLWAQLKQLKLGEGEQMQTTFQFSDFLGDSDLPPSARARLEGLDFDLFRDIRSITIAGTEEGDVEDNVAILDVSGLAKDVIGALSEIEGYHRMSKGGVTIHTFTDPDDHEASGACFLHQTDSSRNEFVAVFSRDTRKVVNTARLLRGEAQPLRRDFEGNLHLRPSRSSLVYFEAVGSLPGLDQIDEASMVTKYAKSVKFDLGEQDGYVEANIRVGTEAPEKAMQISQMLQGLTAMAGLMGSEQEPEMELVQRLISGLSFKTDAKQFIIDFEFESYELVQIFKKMSEY